jgi:protein phosphatase methylesterase 1
MSVMFEQAEDVLIPGTTNVFRVYSSGPAEGPCMVFLHGAGHSALTWSLVAECCKGHCGVMAIDFRQHGGTKTSDDRDMSVSTLCADVLAVLKVQTVSPERSRPIILVGHSMGGAIAARVALAIETPREAGSDPCGLCLQGLVVMDVVEGTAVASLPHMRDILAQRPARFRSVEEVIQWTLQTGMLRNRQSAVLSVPSQVQEVDGGGFEWRTDLQASEEFWGGKPCQQSKLPEATLR